VTGSDELTLDLISSRGFITEAQSEEVRTTVDEKDMTVPEALGTLGFMSEDQVLMVLASEYGMDTFDLTDYRIPPEAIELVPPGIARQYKVVPVMQTDGTIIVAMSDPTDPGALGSLRHIPKSCGEGGGAPKAQIA